MKTDAKDNRFPGPLAATGVEIQADGARLAGDLTVPPSARGLVLFAHGSGSSRHSPRNQFVAREIHAAGLGTLLFDLLTPAEEEEDGITARWRFDIGLLTYRLIAAARWIVRQPKTGKLGLGLFGASTGAAAALAAAAALGPTIQAVVSRGGRPDLAGEALKSVTAPTLLIVGELDDHVLQLNRSALSRLRGDKHLSVVPGASHLFEERGALEIVARLAANWFTQYLKPE